MSLSRNIYLKCLSSSLTESGEVENVLRAIDQGGKLVGSDIHIGTESSMVPGRLYEFRIHGPFPGYLDGRPCNSNVHSFTSADQLTAVDSNELPPGTLQLLNGGN